MKFNYLNDLNFDSLESIFIQAQTNVLNFLAYVRELDRIGLLAAGASAIVTAITAVLGIIVWYQHF